MTYRDLVEVNRFLKKSEQKREPKREQKEEEEKRKQEEKGNIGKNPKIEKIEKKNKSTKYNKLNYRLYFIKTYKMNKYMNFLCENDSLNIACPNKEKVTGFYKLEKYNVRTIYAWKRPSLKSTKHNIVSQRIIFPNEIWGYDEKYNRNDKYNWVKISEKPIYWIPKKNKMI